MTPMLTLFREFLHDLSHEPAVLLAGLKSLEEVGTFETPRRTIKVLYLQGQGKKPVVKEKTRDLSGMTYQCVFDFGVYA
ncbi:MAG: hypothetical protein PHG30_09985, partial [Eubacteriales bacterium]|nr:hypothetical protein [Eubacteriales bacterium]